MGPKEMTKTVDLPHRFEQLYSTHRNAIVAYCVRRLPRADAMDAAAETFAVAWRRIKDVPDGRAELSWLYGVAFRVVANQHRTNRRTRGLDGRLAQDTPEPASEPADQVVRAETYNQLMSCLKDLRSSDRELLLLIAWEEHPRAAVAEMLEVSRSALDQRVHRATQRLRKLYDRRTKGRPAANSRGATHESH